MFSPWDSRNTKKLKKQKQNAGFFYKQQSHFSQIVSKKAKITILFFLKNSKNNNIILGFSFMYRTRATITRSWSETALEY